MRGIILVLLMAGSHSSLAQLREGFDPDEAKALIAICNSYTFQTLYKSDANILPEGYQKVFTSDVVGLDNQFQVYKKDKVGIINFRGSTSTITSWTANMYSAMIPSQGVIKINSVDRPYSFAKDTAASLHSGYALAVVFLSPMLLDQIRKLNDEGVYDIILTGHSQGGALANMSRAYLENLPKGEISSKNVFKNYAFADPMCGDKEFAAEYQTRYCETNMSYSIINPDDMVPKMPLHYQDEGALMSKERILNLLTGKEELDWRELGKDFIIRMFEGSLKGYISSSNRLIEKLISIGHTSIDMPAYTSDINYYETGTVRTLQPFPYPKIKISRSKMTDKQRATIVKDEDGNYYQQEPGFFQHNPYNYYVGVVKEYFPKDYKNMERQYLPENL